MKKIPDYVYKIRHIKYSIYILIVLLISNLNVETQNTSKLLNLLIGLLVVLLLLIIFKKKKSDEKLEVALKFMTQTNWYEKESEYLQSLVRFLSKECSVKYALINEIHGAEELVATTVAIFADGKVEENFDYNLQHTPCGNVFDKKICTYNNKVQTLFPKDESLQDKGIKSYIGLPLFGSNGIPLGLIAIMDDKKIKNVNDVEFLLKLVAIRAGIELEKYIHEKEINRITLLNKSILESTEEGIVVFDKNLNYLVWNDPIAKIAEIENENLLGKYILDVFPSLKENGIYDDLKRVLKEGVKVQSEYEYINPSNEKFWLRDYSKPMINDKGNIVGVIKKLVDITSYKEKETELIRLNNLRIKTFIEENKFDLLTGTYTKKYGVRELENRIMKYTKSIITISYIDLNNLKVVNDTWGHSEGDKMIKLVCETISKSIRNSDFLIRFGGDEFLLVFTKTSEKEANRTLNRVNEELRDIEKKYDISFAFGVTSINSSEDKSLDEYIKIADSKMYKKKKKMKCEHNKCIDIS